MKSIVHKTVPASLCFLACAGILALVTGCNREKPTEEILFRAEADANVIRELEQVVEEYNQQSDGHLVTLVNEDRDDIDLFLGPYTQGGIAWRSIGWRLWTRLETLAAIEGEVNRSLIRGLREGSMGTAEFGRMLTDIRDLGVVPIVVPLAPGSYAVALNSYLGYVSEHTDFAVTWRADSIVVEARDLRTAVDQIVDGRAAFIVGDDQMGSWLGRSNDNHPEGFVLPGSSTGSANWVIGRGETISVASMEKQKAGAAAFVTYLTSKGIAQRFAQVLPGKFYYWSESPADGALPVVNGPTVFIDPDEADR